MEYNGCKNCVYQIEPLRACEWAERGGDGCIHLLCPKWEKRKMTNEKIIEIMSRPLTMKNVPVDILEAHKAVVELLQQEPKWIPVSERLPESDDDVLVTNGRGMYIGWIDPTDKVWRVDSESEYFMEDIIAWMPLPAPYKAESEG